MGRGSRRLRQLERKAQRRREALANAGNFLAHDWMWEERRWDLFDPLSEAASDFLGAEHDGDEEAMRKANDRYERAHAALMEAYTKREEQSG